MSKLFEKHKGLDYAIFYAALVIGVIAGIVVFAMHADTKPATYEDYAPLYQQVEALEADFSILGDMENVDSFNATKGKFVLKGGKQCDLAVYFNPTDNTITSTVEIDKCLTPMQYVATLIMSALAGFGITFLIISAVFVIVIVAEKIKKETPAPKN